MANKSFLSFDFGLKTTKLFNTFATHVRLKVKPEKLLTAEPNQVGWKTIHKTELNTNFETCLLVIHGCLVVLRRLLMMLWVLVRLLLVVRQGVDPHVAVVPTSLGVSHGSGGEVRGRQHDWGLHALLPHLAAATALL